MNNLNVGVFSGLIIALYVIFVILYKRFKKEKIKEIFIKNQCFNKNKIYMYWSYNTKPNKRGVPVFINKKSVGISKRGNMLVLDKPKRDFTISALFEEHPGSLDIEYSNKPVLLLVDETGTISKYKMEASGIEWFGRFFS